MALRGLKASNHHRPGCRCSGCWDERRDDAGSIADIEISTGRGFAADHHRLVHTFELPEEIPTPHADLPEDDLHQEIFGDAWYALLSQLPWRR